MSEIKCLRTHKSLADELGVPISAVAMIREVTRSSSADAIWAMAKSEGDLVAASRRLALLRRCYAVADSITSEVAAAVVAAS